jgi:hypothetical protein
VREEVSRRNKRRGREAHVLGNHLRMVVSTTRQLCDQVLVGQLVGIDRLQLAVSLDRGRLDRLIPVTELLSPELPLEHFFRTLVALRDVAFRRRPHCLVRKAVNVLALERVEQNPVEAHEILNAAPKCLRMDLCPVARHRSRKVDRVELPRAGAGGLETKLGDFRRAVHWSSFSSEIHFAFFEMV